MDADADLGSICLNKVAQLEDRARSDAAVVNESKFALIPFVPIKGCNCVTFAGSIIFTHYAGADEI